jgi:hypothetical protein
MGFTTSCFIRKNSKELQNKLADIGYKFTCFPSGDALITENERSLAYIEKLSNVPYYGIEEDCGTNEELFLAIAALRDDSVIYQWFTDGEKWHKRVVFMKKCDRYLAWGKAETVEEAENKVNSAAWRFAKDIEEPKEFTITLSDINSKIDDIKRIFGAKENDKIVIKVD